MLEEFGPNRVIDTPITELGFAGVGVGAAMVGLRPIIEFMTWNFALLAIDQIVNSAAKMRYMSGGQVGMPIVFRGPAGAALQLGAQHSQCFEAMYAHIPGSRWSCRRRRQMPRGLLKSAIRDDDPIVFMEGEMLYNVKGEVPEGEHLVPIGKADVKRAGDHVSLICYSRPCAESQGRRTARGRGHLGGSTGSPDHPPTRSRGSPHLREQDPPRGGGGGGVVLRGGRGLRWSMRSRRASSTSWTHPWLRVTGIDVPMPYNKHLEKAAKVSPERIVSAAKKFSTWNSCPSSALKELAWQRKF